MRVAGTLLVVSLGLASCAPEVTLGADLQHANGRVGNQTSPASVAVYSGDVPVPYDVLGDVQVIVRQRSAFGEVPTTEHAIQALKEQAGRLGAHAVVMVAFGRPGMSMWSYHELRGHGRAIRFR